MGLHGFAPGEGGLRYFHVYVGSGHFRDIKIGGGGQKNEYFLGMKIM